MVPWQPWLSLHVLVGAFKANIYMLYIIYNNICNRLFDLSDTRPQCCITALGFISGSCYTARTILNFGGVDKSDKTINITYNYMSIMLKRVLFDF